MENWQAHGGRVGGLNAYMLEQMLGFRPKPTFAESCLVVHG